MMGSSTRATYHDLALHLAGDNKSLTELQDAELALTPILAVADATLAARDPQLDPEVALVDPRLKRLVDALSTALDELRDLEEDVETLRTDAQDAERRDWETLVASERED